MSYRDYIPRIFRDKEKWSKWIKIVEIEENKLKETLDDVKQALFVDTAKGKDLDRLAKLFNLVRKDGEDDESFRARIKSYFQSVTRSATKTDIENYFYNLFNLNVNVFDRAKAVFGIKFTDAATQEKIRIIYENVDNVRAAGVYYTLELKVFWLDEVDIIENVDVEDVKTEPYISENVVVDDAAQIENTETEPYAVDNVNVTDSFSTYNYKNSFILGYSKLNSKDVLF